MLSFVCTQSSFGKKARAWLPRSRLCAPTQASHSLASSVLVVDPARITAMADTTAAFDVLICGYFISLSYDVFRWLPRFLRRLARALRGKHREPEFAFIR